MSTNNWIALAAVFSTLEITVIGAAMWIGRVVGAQQGKAEKVVSNHEHDCANYEPNTAVQLRVLVGNNEP